MQEWPILVVDDDEAWIETIRIILGDHYEIRTASTPSAALSLLQSGFCSLAILDQRLCGEGQGGINLLKRLREAQRDLKGIILTGYAGIEDAVNSMKDGAFDYVSKGMPNLAEELHSRVERALMETIPESIIKALIRQGESAGLEFKSSVRWDRRLKKVNHDLSGAVVKTVAAFLNSSLGGALLIGVGDQGDTIGLRDDFATLRRQDRDGFETLLMTLFSDAYGKDVVPLIGIDFHVVDGNEICRVLIKPSSRPVFVSDGLGGEHLYIRAGNSSRQLSTREALDYCKVRWS